MLMCNIETKMDEAAAILAEYFNVPELVVESVIEGNLNYSFKATISDKKLFIKLFSSRLSIPKKKFRDVTSRYEMEKYVLATCNQANYPVPKLLASFDNEKILVQQNLDSKSLMTYLLDDEAPDSTLFLLGMWIGGFHNIFEQKTINETALTSEYAFIKNTNTYQNNHALERVIQIVEETSFSKRVFSRCDCHLGNFIIHDSMLFGIDFEMCSFQPPAMDLATIFINYMDLMFNKSKNGTETKNIISLADIASLLEGYREATGEDFTPVFYSYIATVLFKKYKKSNNRKYLNMLNALSHIM